MHDDGAVSLLLSPPLGWVLSTVFGALWGSFFNVAVHRLGREDARLRDLLHPPSHCPACKAPIAAYDNVPVLGWLLLGGRCRRCRAPISIRYPLVELAGAGIGAAVYYRFVLLEPAPPPLASLRFLAYFFFVGTLFVLALIDLETMLLPEAITLPSIPLFFVLGRFLPDVPLVDALVGAAAGFGLLKALQLGYAAATGREGLGGGDAMLMAVVGGFLGWKALPFSLGLGALLGTAISVPLLLLQRRRSARDAALQKTDAAAHNDAASQQEDAAAHNEAASQQEDAATQHAPAPVSIRHVEVPFGPFLVAGALTWLFCKDALWALLVGLTDRP